MAKLRSVNGWPTFQEADTFNLFFDKFMELEKARDSSFSPLVLNNFAYFPNALVVTF